MIRIYNKLSDQELAELLKEGDREAFTEIYDRYAPKVYYQINQIVRNAETAKDLVQDLFITIWNKAGHIKANANLGGYLYIAAQNSVLKYIRDNRLQVDYLDSLSELADEITEEQNGDYDIEVLYNLIEIEISKLPEKMRTIFELSRRGDLSYKQIAAELGIADNTVKKQVSNALKIIRTNVDKHAQVGLIVIALMRK